MRRARWLFLFVVGTAGCGGSPPAPTEAVAVPTVSSTAKPLASKAARRGKTETGIAWRELTRGEGEVHPLLNDDVEVLYTGFKANGGRFDGAEEKPTRFGVARVIPGWTEILQMMVVGDRWRVEVPSALAYGDSPEIRGAPAGDLVFELELVRIHPAPPVPQDVSGAPAGAERTQSGLAYRVLERGDGERHPGGIDRVRVHYTGWTTDGKMFDTTAGKDRPARMQVNGVIDGFGETLSLMVEGDRFRVWIPPELAYGTTPQPGRPVGTLVYDIELVELE